MIWFWTLTYLRKCHHWIDWQQWRIVQYARSIFLRHISNAYLSVCLFHILTSLDIIPVLSIGICLIMSVYKYKSYNVCFFLAQLFCWIEFLSHFFHFFYRSRVLWVVWCCFISFHIFFMWWVLSCLHCLWTFFCSCLYGYLLLCVITHFFSSVFYTR